MICTSAVFFISAQVIDIGQRSNILVSSVMEETGGIGVDVVVDNGGKLPYLNHIYFPGNRKFVSECYSNTCNAKSVRKTEKLFVGKK